MGNWGFKLTQGDTFLDIVDTYKTYYNLGDKPEEIELSILDEYSEVDTEDSDIQDLIFGIAYGHWHINALNEKHFKRIAEVIEKDLGMNLWKEQGEKSYHKRKQALIDFREKLKIPRPKPLKKKNIKQHICPFEVEDIISIELDDNSYGAALVLSREGDEPEKRVKYGTQYMVFSSLKFDKKPSISDVLKSNILYNPENGGYFIKNIYAATLSKRILKGISRIGNVEIKESISLNFRKTNYCFNSGEIDDFINHIERHNTEKLPSKIKIEDILKSKDIWDKMLIHRYDLMDMDIRDEI